MEGGMIVYGLKACDTCRAAVKALTAAGHAVELVDVRAAPLSRADLERFHAAFGAALVNRRSTTWRGLSEAERAGAPVDLLAAHPTLMKRPVIEAGGALHLGWGAEVKAALL
jgi:arsenate reductase-like glutaredoxin family protein